MPVRVSCPHCQTPCLVAEQHLGVPLKCGRCARTFTAPANAVGATGAAPTALAVRLDVGVASSSASGSQDEATFLMQHFVCTNLDERHELAVLLIAGHGGTAAPAVSLAPLLSKVLIGSSKDAAEVIAACKRVDATAVVVWAGQVHLCQTRKGRIYHHRAGQLTSLTRDALQLAPGDWLVVTDAGLNASTLQQGMAQASPSAAHQAQQLVERANGTILAVRCH